MSNTTQPVTVAGAIAGVLTTGVALAAILYPDRLDQASQVAIIAFGNSVIITAAVLWTQLRVTPLSDPKLERNTEVKVLDNGQPTGDTVIVQPSPPGPVGVEGGDPAGAG